VYRKIVEAEKLQYLCNGLTDFDETWHGDMPWSSRPPQHKIFMTLQIQDVGQSPSEKS